jgi:hypothetical protein
VSLKNNGFTDRTPGHSFTHPTKIVVAENWALCLVLGISRCGDKSTSTASLKDCEESYNIVKFAISITFLFVSPFSGPPAYKGQSPELLTWNTMVLHSSIMVKKMDSGVWLYELKSKHTTSQSWEPKGMTQPLHFLSSSSGQR